MLSIKSSGILRYLLALDGFDEHFWGADFQTSIGVCGNNMCDQGETTALHPPSLPEHPPSHAQPSSQDKPTSASGTTPATGTAKVGDPFLTPPTGEKACRVCLAK